MTTLTSPFFLKGFTFTELLHPEGLNRLDSSFLVHLKSKNVDLSIKLNAYREGSLALSAIELSEFLIQLAQILEGFLSHLFNIEEEVAISQVRTTTHNPISTFKKYFVLRRAKKELFRPQSLLSFEALHQWMLNELKAASLQTSDLELAIALQGVHYLNSPDKYKVEIEKLVAWCIQALVSVEGKKLTQHWSSFRIPEKLDYNHLIPIISDKSHLMAPAENIHLRDGFTLTDPRMDAREVQNEVNYCIYCHDHEGDFCSKGFPVKKGDPSQGFKRNPLDTILTGCPLEEKISEMHHLKKEGFTLASLAMIMVDNPLCPATGHRICNDCMKACIYQKQEPVNIPQIETRVLTDVLSLPWGVEIYDLLTKWNPLRPKQWVMKPYNGLKVMIAGMGPAGFTLAHHLLLEGFAVVGFDGLKVEPFSEKWIKEPIYSFAELYESLDERIMGGFGGVAEYGITVRWDKNFLKLIYLSLLRRHHFKVLGSVRFGGSLLVEDAWKLGFDHFVIAVGAGLPKALSIPNSMAPGMRQANDFLMALQLGNAAKKSSLTNLQIRLPAVVIGSGLTAVDTATELQAYYICLVEKVSKRYKILIKAYGENYFQHFLPVSCQEILTEYLQHGEAIAKERENAKCEKRLPDFLSLLRKWGGVTIAYRRSMQESPAYINNHEELKKALEEGIYYLEGVEPKAVELNEHGYAEVLVCLKRMRNTEKEWLTTQETLRLPARSILVATGTQPNTAYEFEHKGTFNRLNLQYQHYEEKNKELISAHGVLHCKDPLYGPFTSYQKGEHRVSLIGDTHPVFHGSVVKAMASGMHTYTKIKALLLPEEKTKLSCASTKDYHDFAKNIDTLFTARMISLVRKTTDTLEIKILAPQAAQHFKPGQFFRLQNFESLAPHVNETLLQMEPLILPISASDNKAGTLTALIIEKNAAASLCKLLKPGDPIALMGPTGVRAKIPSGHETILIIGDRSSFAFVQSYGTEAKKAGNRVIYIAHLSSILELFCQKELEEATDTILWVTQSHLKIHPHRSQDESITSDHVIELLSSYANHPSFLLGNVDRIFLIAEPNFLRAFQKNRDHLLKFIFLKAPKIFAAVYGNMQCMLKGVCAQCLQWQIDPETGERTKAVFACSWQDQPLEIIDIDHMEARQKQNELLDKMNKCWVDYLFAHSDIDAI